MHISNFHKVSIQSFKSFSIQQLISKEKHQIDFYFNEKVQNALKNCGRLPVYQNLFSELYSIKLETNNINLPYGFIHGDCSPDNLISVNKKVSFLDFDNLLTIYRLINIVSCYRGFSMALSTEYYCFEKQKFSREILDKLFLNKIILLLENIKSRLKELEKC